MSLLSQIGPYKFGASAGEVFAACLAAIVASVILVFFLASQGAFTGILAKITKKVVERMNQPEPPAPEPPTPPQG